MTEKSEWERLAERAGMSNRWAVMPQDVKDLAEEHIPRAHKVLNAAMNYLTDLSNDYVWRGLWLYRKGHWDDNDLITAGRNHERHKWLVLAVRRLYGVTDDVVKLLGGKVTEFTPMPDDLDAIPEDYKDHPDEKSDRQKWEEITELAKTTDIDERRQLLAFFEKLDELLGIGEDQ